MIHFDELYATACLHKGGSQIVEASLPQLRSDQALIDTSDAFYLSTMMRRIFRAGLKHSVIDAKWPAFEKALNQFNPTVCAHMTDEKLDELMGNRDLVRHLGKMKAIRINASLVLNLGQGHGGFGAFLAQWPPSEIVDLWRKLKKEGAQLGGISGAYFLRMAGKDTFLLTDDVVAVLRAQGVIDKAPTSMSAMTAVQGAFNQWQEQCGRPYCEISRIASMAVASFQ